MTFTQLEYIVALDAHRHFAEAAAQCFITQPTLSMQVQKLEEELGVKIFDRSKQPVLPTEPGIDIIDHARKILAERDILTDMIASKKGVVNGELKLGVIPTLAPYLLPLFIPAFTKKFANVKLVINELTTDVILSRLREGRIDAGILVTPLNEKGIKEDVLFYEEMLAYVSKNNKAFKKTYMLPNDIDPEKLWLLQEGHCFREQMLQLCELRKGSKEGSHASFFSDTGTADRICPPGLFHPDDDRHLETPRERHADLPDQHVAGPRLGAWLGDRDHMGVQDRYRRGVACSSACNCVAGRRAVGTVFGEKSGHARAQDHRRGRRAFHRHHHLHRRTGAVFGRTHGLARQGRHACHRGRTARQIRECTCGFKSQIRI